MSNGLAKDELELLKWLGEAEFSQYGECYGEALNGLVSKGLAQIHEDDQSKQINFVTRGRTLMYDAVSLTEDGKKLLETK